MGDTEVDTEVGIMGEDIVEADIVVGMVGIVEDTTAIGDTMDITGIMDTTDMGNIMAMGITDTMDIGEATTIGIEIGMRSTTGVPGAAGVNGTGPAVELEPLQQQDISMIQITIGLQPHLLNFHLSKRLGIQVQEHNLLRSTSNRNKIE